MQRPNGEATLAPVHDDQSVRTLLVLGGVWGCYIVGAACGSASKRTGVSVVYAYAAHFIVVDIVHRLTNRRGHVMDPQAEVPWHPGSEGALQKLPTISRKVSEHLANERTFLAWIRTGLATITFGFVVERFGLVVRELDPKTQSMFVFSFQASALVGIALTVLGVTMFVVALLNFLRTRQAIDAELFHSSVGFAVVLAVLSSAIGGLLAVYLLLSA